MKLFPGNLYSPAMIKAIKGPLPQANIMPTGGVSLSNLGEWIQAGAVAVGIGSDLTSEAVKTETTALLLRRLRNISRPTKRPRSRHLRSLRRS